MTPRPILVTGAAGFIGTHLVSRLRSAGLDVVATARRDAFTYMDITEPSNVERVFAEVQPRAVVHSAAIVDDRGDRQRFLAVNVGGTSHVLEAALRHGVERFVHVSSIVALGLDPGPNADERSPLVFSGGNAYFDTKAHAEELVRDFFARTRLPGVIVRPGDVWGPGSMPWVERPLILMRQWLPVLIDGGRGLMAHCHIDNLVDALLLVLDSPAAVGTTLQITDGVSTTTYRDYFSRLATAAGLSPPRFSLGRRLAPTLAGVLEVLAALTGRQPPLTRAVVRYLARRSTYSITLAKQTIGYQPRVDLDTGMALLGDALRRRTTALA